MSELNRFVREHIRILEMIGVVMRIVSFSIVSWLGAASPFFFVWCLNTVDAAGLTWCAVLRRDPAYTLLNSFWVLIGLVGIARAGGWLA